MKRLNPIPSLSLAVALVTLRPAEAVGQIANVNFEGKPTNPVRLSPDGTRLFAVNTPDAPLSVFDVSSPANPILIAKIPVGLEPVSVNSRSNDEAWVVNEVSDSVSIVSLARGLVTDTLAAKDEPYDVGFAAGRAFVSCSRNNQIRVFDANPGPEGDPVMKNCGPLNACLIVISFVPGYKLSELLGVGSRNENPPHPALRLLVRQRIRGGENTAAHGPHHPQSGRLDRSRG